MCGISGFIDFNRGSTSDTLIKMSGCLSHRGPDGEGFYFTQHHNCHIGLAHKRLAILDLSDAGKQPMHFNNLSITFNGEIYNYREIRQELIEFGFLFDTNSDTEVILKAYYKWGINCLNKFIGMFAFVIYDAQNENVICVRDRAGVKPFFYYHHEHLFLFGSELKAITAHPKFNKEINLSSTAMFMQYGNVPSSHCIYQNCFKIEPGHYLILSLKNKKKELTRYWNVYDYYNAPKLKISFNEAKEETKKILTSAAEYRMIADVPVGIFLSGGFDSTCLTALLQKNRPHKLKTFTIGIKDSTLDEAPYAREIAKHLGTDHHEYYCNEADALDLLKDLIYVYDEPFGDPSAIPTSLVAKIASRDVTVVLSADGGDEVFAGYNRYDYLMKYQSSLARMPEFFRNSIRLALSFLSKNQKDPLSGLRIKKILSLLRDPSPQNFLFQLSQQFTDKDIKSIFSQDIVIPQSLYYSSELKNEFFSPLSYMLAVDYQTYLPDDILQKVDRASMVNSIEAREPFLDHRLIEWAAQLPDSFKYKDGVKKLMLREIVYDHVPKNLMDRPKMGFAAPVSNWMNGALKDSVDYYLDETRIKDQNIFAPEFVRQLKRNYFSGDKKLELKLWYLLVFQMWFDKWMR